MDNKKRIIVCEFRQESNTFNPIPMPMKEFEAVCCYEGKEAYDNRAALKCEFHGMIDAVEQAGGEVIPAIVMRGHSGGRVEDNVLEHFKDRLKYYIDQAGNYDGVFCCLHGATVMVSEEDACGNLMIWLRKLIGEDKVIAAAFDLHANITPAILKNADVVCGYQTYPHVDYYSTGFRAAKIGMSILSGMKSYLAAVRIPVLTPPVGYSTKDGKFMEIIDSCHELVNSGRITDFTVFNVQPWLDIHEIASTVVAIADDQESAIQYADLMAKLFFDNKDEYWPDLYTVDDAIDRAEAYSEDKPVVLVNSADSPNGGAVGDSVATAIRLIERNSQLKAGMFVKDPEAVELAFKTGVGNEADFEIGGKFTPGIPGPLKAHAIVKTLSDGKFCQEGPAGRYAACDIGKAAVLRIGNIDILVCEQPQMTGDPQIFRHFGIEPSMYDLIEVKANTSFLVPYSKITDQFCYADVPGAGSANLKQFKWERIPTGMYPIDLPEDYEMDKSKLWR